jgi:hypothetical protein
MAKKPVLEPVNKGGRPRVLIADAETLDKLKIIASRLHTQPEAAALFEVSLATFEGFLRANAEAREIWDGGHSTGRAALRRMQFSSAQKGNVQMQIWLGKQYLKQVDKSENTLEAGESFKDVWSALGKAGATK